MIVSQRNVDYFGLPFTVSQRAMQLDIKPIGTVKPSRREVTDDYWGNVTAVIYLDDKIFKRDATLNLDSFSHIEVIFYMDQVDPAKITALRVFAWNV